MSAHRIPLRLDELESRCVPSAVSIRPISPGDEPLSPRELANIGGTLFFSGHHGGSGRELWKSDGTDAGTVLVKDVYPGDGPSGIGDSYPERLTNVNGTVFFVARDGTHGDELWKSDGTDAGTALVKDICPGPEESNPSNLTNVGGTLFFTAHDGSGQYVQELWKSDGTAAGTVRVRGFNPAQSAGIGAPKYLTNVNGTLFFSIQNGLNNDELWKSDGTAAGTTLVKTLGGTGATRHLTNVSGTLFFRANSPSHPGYEVWKSDGTPDGTVLVRDSFVSSIDSRVCFTNVSGTLFFTDSDAVTGAKGLWKSDGTTAGTVPVFRDVNDPVGKLIDVDGTVFFNTDQKSVDDTATGLWKSDGTTAGTALVKTILLPGRSPYLRYAADVNGTLFFESSADSKSGFELWQSDGTEAGTVLVKDINPGANGSFIDGLTNVNGTLFFAADDGTHGSELWTNAPDPNNVPFPADAFVVGAVDGTIQIIDAGAGTVARSGLRPLDGASPYTGLVSVALGDYDGDGTPDVFVAAANPSGASGLDPSKAGQVFVYDGADAVDGTLTLLHTITPFATTDGPAGSTAPYTNGLNIAVGDVNGDGKVDLIAGSRGGNGTPTGGNREVGRLVVISGASPHGTNTVIGGIQKPFGGGYEKGVVVDVGNADGVGGLEVAVTRGGPVASPNPEVQKIKVKVLQLRGASLTELPLNADGSTSFAPFGSLTGAANAIRRDARVAWVDSNGDGKAELVFSALDPLTNPSNPQVRLIAYSIDTSAGFGSAVVLSLGGYLAGGTVTNHAITQVAGTGTSQNLALITQSASSGVAYLDPLTGTPRAGGLSLSIATGGITIDGT